MAAFWGMHLSPSKHSYAWLPRKCDYRTDRHTHTDERTDRQTPDKVIPMCRYASQATQKQYMAIAIRWKNIAIYHNTFFLYRDTPTTKHIRKLSQNVWLVDVTQWPFFFIIEKIIWCPKQISSHPQPSIIKI